MNHFRDKYDQDQAAQHPGDITQNEVDHLNSSDSLTERSKHQV